MTPPPPLPPQSTHLSSPHRTKPFNKTSTFSQPPSDYSDLQQVFHHLRSGDGLMPSAVRMFDGLSKDGLTQEALALFSQINDRGAMPDVVTQTAVIEAYSGAGRGKEALRTYLRILLDGVNPNAFTYGAAGAGRGGARGLIGGGVGWVRPNAYTYSVLIKGLAGGGKVGEAGKHLVEMVGVGMKPNAGTIAAVF